MQVDVKVINHACVHVPHSYMFKKSDYIIGLQLLQALYIASYMQSAMIASYIPTNRIFKVRK